nr:uncharacterized protein LOC117604263 [Osmia lignaria]
MARNAKKKLAIFAGTSKCLIYAEAKYCASETPGEIKYYECSRTEYCCGIGCCVSPGLHFHHLWYYWILVIIMFLVCSGGGWWYRYWLQGRYRAATSAIPARTSNPRGQNPLRGPTCQGQRARITYNSARNTVLLHRMWKGPQRNGTVPVYNGNATTSTNYQNVNVVLNDANCPYYQLYGPPPSYETVIAQTRGKISNPASSPDSTNTQAAMQPNMQSSAGVAANSSVPQCFSYACNSSARLNNAAEQEAQYRHGNVASRQLDNPECVPLPHFPQYCLGMDGPIGQNVCVPFTYQERPPAFVPEDSFNRIYQATSTNYVPYPTEKPSDAPDTENPGYELSNAKRYSTMVNIDCTPGSSKDESVWKRSDRSISKIHGSNKVERGASEKVEENRGQTRESRSETEASFSSAFNTTEDSNRTNDSKSTVDSPEDFESEYAKSDRVYGGSLRAIGRYAGQAKRKEYPAENALSKIMPHSCDGLINTEPTATGANRRNASSSQGLNTVNVSANSFQSNPSNNVILARFDANGSSSSTENLDNEAGRSRLVNTSTSTNSDLESNHRLDRSKSLD